MDQLATSISNMYLEKAETNISLIPSNAETEKIKINNNYKGNNILTATDSIQETGSHAVEEVMSKLVEEIKRQSIMIKLMQMVK